MIDLSVRRRTAPKTSPYHTPLLTGLISDESKEGGGDEEKLHGLSSCLLKACTAAQIGALCFASVNKEDAAQNSGSGTGVSGVK